MSLILVTLISIFGFLYGRFLFKKWINHLTIYSTMMGGVTFFYELKLLPYPDLVPLAWFFLLSSSLCFLFGILTIIKATNLFSKKIVAVHKEDVFLPIFSDKGKALKYSILFFSFIGLFVAVQRWLVLINMFGSITNVLLNAGIVYRLNVNKEIKEFIPILPYFVYVAVFLSAIYTAYKGRFSFLTFLPFIGIIVKELTYFGRGEMLFSLMEFFFAFYLFRYLLNKDSKNRYKFSKTNALIATTLLLALFITGSSVVRVSRGAFEKFKGASKELNQLKDNLIISPSVYLYLSSDIGVFSKYLEHDGEDTKFGQNTFRIVYDLLSKFKIVDEPSYFQKGYYIPMWTNTGTYIRELHADFGVVGVFLVPYLMGLAMTLLWYKFYERKSLIVFAILVYLFLIVGHSFIMMVTRLNPWLMSLIFIILYIPILEKFATRNCKSINRS